MGKRARSRGDGGAGAAQRHKARQLGLDLHGVSKPMLDAMNDAAKRRYAVGVGVVVQEEERERKLADSFVRERDELPWWALIQRNRLGKLANQHAEAAAVWTERLRKCAEDASVLASDRDLARAAARR